MRTRRAKKKKIHKTPTILRLRLGTTKENLFPKTIKLGETPSHTKPVLQLTRKVKKNTGATWDHYLHISPDTSHCMEAVFSMVRKICGKQPGDPLEDLNVKLAFCGLFTNTTLLAAVLLGKDYDMNMRFVKNYLWKTTGQLFSETEKLISRQKETSGKSMINFQDLRWVSTSSLHSRADQYATAKAYIFSDSVLYLGKWELEEANPMVFAQQPL